MHFSLLGTWASGFFSSPSRGSLSVWTFAADRRTLRVNYRTSHQIRMQADRLLGPKVTDADGNDEDRSDTISVFNGPPPTIETLKSEKAEIKTVCTWLKEQAKAGLLPHEIRCFRPITGTVGPSKDGRQRSGDALQDSR